MLACLGGWRLSLEVSCLLCVGRRFDVSCRSCPRFPCGERAWRPWGLPALWSLLLLRGRPRSLDCCWFLRGTGAGESVLGFLCALLLEPDLNLGSAWVVQVLHDQGRQRGIACWLPCNFPGGLCIKAAHFACMEMGDQGGEQVLHFCEVLHLTLLLVEVGHAPSVEVGIDLLSHLLLAKLGCQQGLFFIFYFLIRSYLLSYLLTLLVTSFIT